MLDQLFALHWHLPISQMLLVAFPQADQQQASVRDTNRLQEKKEDSIPCDMKAANFEHRGPFPPPLLS